MIHLMELPNPDPMDGRPSHGGRDRHFCVGVESVEPLIAKLDAHKIEYTKSMSGRPAVFFRDPDMNCLEVGGGGGVGGRGQALALAGCRRGV
jgi:glyoxylase I family protein